MPLNFATSLKSQPWIRSANSDLVWLISPLILPVVAVMLFAPYFQQSGVTLVWWVILVLGIDVAHVYSTLFRFYWEPELFRKHKLVLVFTPLLSLIVGIALYLQDPLLFWRVLAYVAVFHFIRQQYGFMRLYSRKEKSTTLNRRIDQVAIYSATLYPLLYWHLFARNKINWFVPDDFLEIPMQIPGNLLLVIYGIILIIYSIREIHHFTSTGSFNLPRFLIVAGTAASWYVGIVWYQGDLLFTLLNVVSHGIPYMALVWFYGEKRNNGHFKFNWRGILIFTGTVLVLAWLEEGLWDRNFWLEHGPLFPEWLGFEHVEWIPYLAPVLVLPQITHYIVDGFIWKAGSAK